MRASARRDPVHGYVMTLLVLSAPQLSPCFRHPYGLPQLCCSAVADYNLCKLLALLKVSWYPRCYRRRHAVNLWSVSNIKKSPLARFSPGKGHSASCHTLLGNSRPQDLHYHCASSRF